MKSTLATAPGLPRNARNLTSRVRIGLRVIGCAALALAAAGCISTERTVYREETRLRIEFENDTAGRLFYETLSHVSGRRARSESHSRVSLPIIFDCRTTVREGESIAFNKAVRECDSNHDGRITETEARIFAGRYPQP